MEANSRMLLNFLMNSVWQIALVAAAAVAAARLARSAPARHRHCLWVMALALSVLLPVSTAVRSVSVTPLSSPPGGRTTAATHPEAALRSVAGTNDPSPLSTRGPVARSYAFRIENYLHQRTSRVAVPGFLASGIIGGYLLFLVFRLLRLAQAWRKTTDLRRSARAREIPDWMETIVARCQTAMGLKLAGEMLELRRVPLGLDAGGQGTGTASRASLLCSPKVTGPITLGWRRPVIIVPESFFGQVPPEDVTAALAHELAHIRRQDFMLNVLYELIYWPISFHPAARMIKRRIDETREIACDELAVGTAVDAATYARSLVSIARTLSGPPPFSQPGYTLGVFDANILEERVMKLLDRRPRLGVRRATLIFAAGLALLVLSAMAASAFSLSLGKNARAAALAASKKSLTPPDFSGRWTMEKAESHFDGMFPRSFGQTIEQQGDHLKITNELKPWFDGAGGFYAGELLMRVPTLQVTADGTEHIATVENFRVSSRTHWEGSALITDWKVFSGTTDAPAGERKTEPRLEATWVRYLSDDGRLQFLDITNHRWGMQSGPTGDAELVFVRSTSSNQAEGNTDPVPDGTTGSISGTASDPSGARVPEAFVSVSNEKGGMSKTIVTDDAGEFSLRSLPSGNYKLEVRKSGFKVSRLEVVLGSPLGNAGEFNLQLEPETVLQAVEVTAKAPPGYAESPAKGRPKRIRVGGLVELTKLVRQVKPEYPERARAKGIQGIAMLEAVISMEGVPLSLHVVESPDPALAEAAMEAVKQWRYEPTRLNGEPVEVVTEIAVRFKLEN